MNLQPVRPHAIDLKHPVRVTCVTCREDFPMHTGYADLDGKPFRAYHCQTCGDVIRARQFVRDNPSPG